MAHRVKIKKKKKNWEGLSLGVQSVKSVKVTLDMILAQVMISRL